MYVENYHSRFPDLKAQLSLSVIILLKVQEVFAFSDTQPKINPIQF